MSDRASAHPMPAIITVGALTIRRYTEEDAASLGESINASVDHLRPWMEWIHHEPVAGIHRKSIISEWKRSWDENRDFVMGVFHGNQFVGSTGVHLRGPAESVELGYWVDVRHVRKGYASSVVHALTSTVFNLWSEISRVEIHVDVNNEASGLVAERCGFTPGKRTQRDPRAPGESGTLIHWVKTREAQGFTTPVR